MASADEQLTKVKDDLQSALNDIKSVVNSDIISLVNLLSIDHEMKKLRAEQIINNINKMSLLQARLDVINWLEKGT